jgi:ubiquinone/menaquinone biosynthesis C-methylase UbiE
MPESPATVAPAVPWLNFAKNWEELTTPCRPTLGECAIFGKGVKKALENSDDELKRILILGSTPELRDLVSDCKAQVVLLDINLDMMLAMSELTKKKNPDEIWVRAGWTATPLQTEGFDCILGDFTVGNLPLEHHEAYYANVHRMLKPTGLYLERIWCCRNSDTPMTLDQVEDVLSKMPVNLLSLNLMWELGTFFVIPRFETQEIRVQNFVDKMNAYADAHTDFANSTMGKLWQMSDHLFPHAKRWWMRERKEWNALTSQWFTIESEEFSSDLNIPEDLRPIFPVVGLARK